MQTRARDLRPACAPAVRLQFSIRSLVFNGVSATDRPFELFDPGPETSDLVLEVSEPVVDGLSAREDEDLISSGLAVPADKYGGRDVGTPLRRRVGQHRPRECCLSELPYNVRVNGPAPNLPTSSDRIGAIRCRWRSDVLRKWGLDPDGSSWVAMFRHGRGGWGCPDEDLPGRWVG